MGTTRSPLGDILALADIEQAGWPVRSEALHRSGVPLNIDPPAPAPAVPAAPAVQPTPITGGPTPPPVPVVQPPVTPPAPPVPPTPAVPPPAPAATTVPTPPDPDASLIAGAERPDAVKAALTELRTEIKTERGERQRLERELEVANLVVELGVPAGVIHGDTPEARRASAQTFLTERDAAVAAALEQAQAATAGRDGGARPRPAPQDLQAQIQAAEAAGNRDEAMRLKSQQLAALRPAV